MFSRKFGLEVEFTGIEREQAAVNAADCLGGSVRRVGGMYNAWAVRCPDGREWKCIYDSSIIGKRKVNGRIVDAPDSYKVEVVSPILTYREDIGTVQSLIRKLRGIGGLTNGSCGIHVHLDGSPHTPRSICNFLKIIASKNDLLYKSLQIKPERIMYCQKLDERLINRIKQDRPSSFQHISDIWYECTSDNFCNRDQHYHPSRYNFLNLHSFFTRHRTVELRGFNSILHAGKVRSYIVLALALNHQALTQTTASSRKVQAANDRFAMRTYLNRIGFIGDEFKSCREHLCKHLSGNGAWRFGRPKRNGGENQ